jgi:tripartite-type tricarboxylate transporter receptor subunit TctC
VLSELWGQPVIVDNVCGAGATAGPAHVAKAAADGHTLLINTSAQAYSAVFSMNLSYDPAKDFVQVIALTRQPYVLVVGRTAPIDTLDGLIAAARAQPGKFRFGSTGIGTGTHVGIEVFNRAARIAARHVPPSADESNADTIENAVAGRFDYYLVPIALALPHITTGNLVAVGVSTRQRSVLLPEVPPIAEAIANFDFPIWYGMWAPAGTPPSVVDRLERDFGRALAEPGCGEWIADHGGEPMNLTRAEFGRLIESERATAMSLVATSGIKT